MTVEGQAAPGEQSSESCLHCESNDLAQEHIDGQENIDVAELEDAGTWYYVVDCATCKAVIPFKYAREDEPILRFPTMMVRCFCCRADHTYAPDLISRRKTAAPRWNFNGHQQPSHPSDGSQEAARNRQEDRSEGDSGVHVIIDRAIHHPVSSSSQRDNILNVAVSGRRPTIFFLSSCFFAAGWASHLALDLLCPAAFERDSSGLAMLPGIAFFGPALLGLVLFIFAIGSSFVEVFGFERRQINRGFARTASLIPSLVVHATSTLKLFLSKMRHRKFPTREVPGVLGGRALQSRPALKVLEPIPFKEAPSAEDGPESCPGKWYSWRWLPARGRRQGHDLGIRRAPEQIYTLSRKQDSVARPYLGSKTFEAALA
jgi:hypothetical protein